MASTASLRIIIIIIVRYIFFTCEISLEVILFFQGDWNFIIIILTVCTIDCFVFGIFFLSKTTITENNFIHIDKHVHKITIVLRHYDYYYYYHQVLTFFLLLKKVVVVVCCFSTRVTRYIIIILKSRRLSWK